jgi:type VI secretion system protein ImpI
MRELGGRFAAMADGLRVLLEARSSLKAEAGLDKTQIGAVGNNPLKASIDRVEAAAALIRARRPGYLPPAEAIEASVRDLVAHELAFMEGVRAALDALLADFDPSALEERLTGGGRVALLLAGGRRAKLWELFVERYAALADQARRRFLGDLDQAFREAYRAKLGQIGSGGRR